MNANKIFELMKAAYDENEALECFGLRYTSEEYVAGDQLENSHQWYQDDPTVWGEECEYNADLGMWDGGELPGVCTIELPYVHQWYDENGSIRAIENAVNTAEAYRYGDNTHLYLVGGTDGEGGNDTDELIIRNPVVVACL